MYLPFQYGSTSVRKHPRIPYYFRMLAAFWSPSRQCFKATTVARHARVRVTVARRTRGHRGHQGDHAVLHQKF